MTPSTVRAKGAAPIDVIVIDVSATGVRIETTADLDVGQEISIGLAGAGTTRAFVAWKRAGHYGCQFEMALEPEGAAQAFSRAQVIHLGAAPVPTLPDTRGSDDLRDLYLHYHPWRLPLDAVLVLIVEVGLFGAALWWLFGK